MKVLAVRSIRLVSLLRQQRLRSQDLLRRFISAYIVFRHAYTVLSDCTSERRIAEFTRKRIAAIVVRIDSNVQHCMPGNTKDRRKFVAERDAARKNSVHANSNHGSCKEYCNAISQPKPAIRINVDIVIRDEGNVALW